MFCVVSHFLQVRQDTFGCSPLHFSSRTCQGTVFSYQGLCCPKLDWREVTLAYHLKSITSDITINNQFKESGIVIKYCIFLTSEPSSSMHKSFNWILLGAGPRMVLKLGSALSLTTMVFFSCVSLPAYTGCCLE